MLDNTKLRAFSCDLTIQVCHPPQFFIYTALKLFLIYENMNIYDQCPFCPHLFNPLNHYVSAYTLLEIKCYTSKH